MPSAVNSRRKVISTRSPMASCVGVDVGQLHRETATPVEVDHGEDDRRAGGVGHAVHGEGHHRAHGVGHGDRLHVVEGATAASTPGPVAGGRRRWCGPGSRRSRTSTPRCARRQWTRPAAGSGRRGGSRVSIPRQERNLPYGSSAPAGHLGGDRPARAPSGERGRSVARSTMTSAPSARWTSTRSTADTGRPPGLPLRPRASTSAPAAGGRRRPDPPLPTRSSTTTSSPTPSLRRERLDRPAVHAGHAHRATSSTLTPAFLSARAQASRPRSR